MYDPKLNEIQNLSLALIEHRSRDTEIRLDDFIAAGFNQSHVLEVIVILSKKTMSNYFNHIFRTPLDQQLSEMAWEPGA